VESLTPDETILGLLAIRPRHGYELLESFRQPDQLGRVWQLSTSQLYAVLKRLERNQWINGHEVIMSNAPPRTEYTITPEGEAILGAWLGENAPSPSIRRVRVEFLSRLFIARALNIPTGRIVRRQRAACHAFRAELIAQQASAAPGIEYLSLAFQISQFDAVLDWIARAELVNNLEEEDEE
jgi:DNA-binding PadR family transcriptional regulator